MDFLFFKDFIYSFLDRGVEKHQRVASPCTAPTGDLVHNPGMCPDWESNWRPFGSQASAQSAESHQPGLKWIFPRKVEASIFESLYAPLQILLQPYFCLCSVCWENFSPVWMLN